MAIDFKADEVVWLKKKHPCGEYRWRIIRLGADVKIKCLGCNRIVSLDRETFEKRVKKRLGTDVEA